MVALAESLKTIADHFGLQRQIDKGIEELNELILELCKARENVRLTENTTSEMADVIIMIIQLMYLGGISLDDLTDEVFAKIDRTLERIASGYYER